MADQVRLSVIIPYYRAAATVGGTLESLSRQRWSEPWEVVISDNEGSDELMEIAQRFMSRLNLRVVDSSDRRGPAHACNVGAEAARGESIAFCGADDEVGSGWLSAMGDALSQHDFVAGREDYRKLNPEWAQRIFADKEPQQRGLGQLNFPPYVRWAGSGTVGIRRSVHARVGGFDESWRALEDIDYSLRVQLSGTELRFVPDAVMHVRLRTTIPLMFEQARLRGKYYTRLYRRYLTPGTGKQLSRKWAITQWHDLLRTCSQSCSPLLSDRGAWFVQLGWNIGVLQGIARYLSPPPAPIAAPPTNALEPCTGPRPGNP